MMVVVIVVVLLSARDVKRICIPDARSICACMCLKCGILTRQMDKDKQRKWSKQVVYGRNTSSSNKEIDLCDTSAEYSRKKDKKDSDNKCTSDEDEDNKVVHKR